jgi:Ca2+-binding RTX toxin-like protein
MSGNTASYTGSAAAVTVDLYTGLGSGGDAAGDVLLNIQNLIGSAHDDVLIGDAGPNFLEGGAGADTLDGGGADYADYGLYDYASYAGSATGVTANLATPSLNTGDAAGDSYSMITGLVGSAFDDILIGDSKDNAIWDGMISYAAILSGTSLGGGDDWIDGAAGNDLIMTGAGNDTVVYDAADTSVLDIGEVRLDMSGTFGYIVIDTIDTVDASSSSDPVTIDLNYNYEGFEIIIGSAFADTLIGSLEDHVFVGGQGADILYGGSGSDTASYAGSAAVSVDLATFFTSGGDAEGDVLSSIENLIGSAYADTLSGDANENVLEGGAGADALSGGNGLDTASYASSAAAVTVNLGLGTASGGDAAGDILSSIENLIGSNFNDVLAGDVGNNRIEGGGGADNMTGGLGQDIYVYKSAAASVEGQMDTINGFDWGSIGDTFDCSVALQGAGYTNVGYYTETVFAGFAAIKAETEQQISLGAQIFVATDGADSYVFINAPGDYRYDAGSDMVIRLVGVHDLNALDAANFHTGGDVYTYNLDNLPV